MRLTDDNQKGFTMVEILIVIAVIGILSSIAIPSYMSYKNKAYNASALSYMQFVSKSEESYWLNSQLYTSAPAGDGPTSPGTLPDASVPSGVGFIIGTFPAQGSDATTGYQTGASFIAFAGHNSGNRVFSIGSGANSRIHWRDKKSSAASAASDAKSEDVTQALPSGWGQPL